MKPLKELGIKLIELGLGFAIGYLTYKLSNEKEGELSLIAGLLTSILTTEIIESFRGQKQFYELKANFEKLLVSLSARFSYNDFLDFLKFGFIEIPKDKVPDYWIEKLWKANEKYWATSHITIDEGWNQAYTSLGIEIQKTILKVNNVDIRRIYIIDTEEELNSMDGILKEQIGGGIKIKYIKNQK